jgi:hypothetical protein
MAETRIGRLTPHVPVWSDRDHVPLALAFANKHSAGLEAPGTIRSRFAASCEAIKTLCGLEIKPPNARS